MDPNYGDRITYEFEMAGVMLGPMEGEIVASVPWDDVPDDHYKVQMAGSSDTTTVHKDNITDIVEEHNDRYTGF
jgi:hypothetical protein